METLRPYQKEIVDKCLVAIDLYSRTCIGLPTAGGKTIIARALIEELLKQNKKIGFIVNRTELIKQTIRTFKSNKVSVLKAGYEKHFDNQKSIQIIMIQTWYARKDKIVLPDLDFILWDEYHEGTENGVMHEEFFKQFSRSKIIGLTATPITADGYKLNNYDYLIDLYRTKDLQRLGFLVKDKWYSSSQKLDLDDIDINNGDYVEKQLSYVMENEKVINNVLSNYKKFADGKKTIVFAVSIDHAELLYEQFKREGYSVALLHSKLENLDEQRHVILDKFKTGEIKIIINVSILTTGFDETSVECIVLARPTKSLRLYIQMVGRSLRLHPGKDEALILDCANNVWEHGLATDDFNFTVEKKDDNKNKKKKSVRLCPQCESANPYTRDTCIHCGFDFEKNKREFDYVLLNEDIKEIVIDDITVKERGFPDLKHIVDLFFIAKNRNPKTNDKGNWHIKTLITDLYQSYAKRFENDGEFFKFLQSKIIVCIRAKHSFYKVKYDFINYFNQGEDSDFVKKLNMIKGYHPKPCPRCGGKLKRDDGVLQRCNETVYFCLSCKNGYSKQTLEKDCIVCY